MTVAVPPRVPPRGPLRRFRELWRTDKAVARLAVYTAIAVPDDDGVVVSLPEPVTVSDLMSVSDAGPMHHLLVGIDLEAVTKEWESGSREPTMRIPGENGRSEWVQLDKPEPEPAPVEPAPVPAQFVGEPKTDTSTRPRDPQYVPWAETREGRAHARRDVPEPAPGTLMDGVPSGERQTFTRWLNS